MTCDGSTINILKLNTCLVLGDSAIHIYGPAVKMGGGRSQRWTVFLVGHVERDRNRAAVVSLPGLTGMHGPRSGVADKHGHGP